MLVEIAAGEDHRIPETSVVEDRAHRARQRIEIAAVEPHALDPDASRCELRRDARNATCALHRVVGVDEQHCVSGKRLREIDESLLFVVVRLHERVCHRAEYGDAEARRGVRGSRSCKADNERGTRRQRAGLGAVCAPQPEVDQRTTAGGQHRARRLRRDHRLEMNQVQDARLEPLRLRDRRHHAQQRLVGKANGAFGHRPHVAGEAQLGQPVGETRCERPAALDPLEFGRIEARLFDEVEHLLEPRGD